MTERRKELIRAAKFTLFSASAALIQILSFTLLNEIFALPYRFSYLTALVLSVLWNFTMNRAVTFRSAGNVPVAMVKVACFYLVFTPLTTWAGDALTGMGWNEYLVLALSMVFNFVTEFFYQRLFVFGSTMDTAER